MLDKKKLTSLTTRIKKANSSFGIMGSMILTYEIDAMTKDEQLTLQSHLASKGTKFKYLDSKLQATITEYKGIDALNRVYG